MNIKKMDIKDGNKKKEIGEMMDDHQALLWNKAESRPAADAMIKLPTALMTSNTNKIERERGVGLKLLLCGPEITIEQRLRLQKLAPSTQPQCPLFCSLFIINQ